MSKDRYTNYRFKNGMITKNRVVVPPMASQTADENGFVTDHTIKHYQGLSKSQVGLIFVEYSFVHQTGKSEKNQLAVDSDDKISGLTKLASIIHQSEALAGLQLVHAGGKTSTDMTGATLMGPSALAVPAKDIEFAKPMEMTESQIQDWIQWFVAAAGRAIVAGFDLVELHAAHGYGLNQWLSPLTNQRKDQYGGSIEGRSRILVSIAKQIRKAYPQTLLAVRLPAQDHLEGGLTVSEMKLVTSFLEKAGVDLIDVSSGIGGWRRPEGRVGQGYLVSDAAQLKVNTSLPVIGVGGIEAGKYIDEILCAKKVDFAAVGRAILQDSVGWGNRNLQR